MNTLIFKSKLNPDERFELMERINLLEPDQTLILQTDVPADYFLNELKMKRFQGLRWTTQGKAGAFEASIQNKNPEDCCGCCGGND